jgi:hypothetical protein
MTRAEYFKYAIKSGIYKSMDWICTAFADTRPRSTDETLFGPDATLFKTQWGYSFIQIDATNNFVLTQIQDTSAKDEGIFNFLDPIDIDSSWFPNVHAPIRTTIGNVLVNAISIVPSFGDKVDFISGKFSISNLEDRIAPLLKDTPAADAVRDPKSFYVDEYMAFGKSLTYLRGFSKLACWAASRVNITAAPGANKYKAELIKEYGDTLRDPVKLAEFEGRLLAFDDQYLKSDPSYGKFMSGKVKNVCRKKMYLTMGAETSFEDKSKVEPIIKCLDEGWSDDPKQIVAMMNGTRIGSYSRGQDTVKGGVTAKILLRATSNFRIVDKDCGTRLGIHRTVDATSVSILMNRYVMTSKGLVLVSNDNKASFVNTELLVRSPMYCKSEGATLCRYCAGENLFKNPTGLALAVNEIGSTILYAFMGAMHAKELSVAKLDLNKLLS